MPATAARAAFVQQEFRSVVWKSDTVLAQYGKVARDTGDTPVETFFDSMTDVQIMANERGALLGRHARAFRIRIGGLVDLDDAFLINGILPGVHVTDTELVADIDCAVATIESYDTTSDQTTIAVWGII